MLLAWIMELLRKVRDVEAWLPYIRHRSALLGAILIGLIWLSVSLFLKNERSSAEQAAVQNSMNLTGAFEEHLSRSIWEIDRSLRLIRMQYQRNPDSFDLMTWLKSAQLFRDEILQVSIIDRFGRIELNSNDMTAFRGVDLSDREHFRVHVDSKSDELFISKPVIGRTTGKWSIQLTRRIENPDGSFGGMIAASLDPAYLTHIYDRVNTGVDGHIRVIGTDGIVRAASGRVVSLLGRDMSAGRLFKRYPKETSGWHYIDGHLSDQVPRLITFRAVKNYPLIVSVGLSTREIFSRVEVERRIAYSVAAVLTLLVAAVTLLSIRGNLQRAKAQQSLERSNVLLNTTLANMPHGVCMFGPDRRIVLANELYSSMYGLSPEQTKPGTTLLEILQARIAVGSSPLDAEKYIADRLDQAFRPEPGYHEDALQDGRVFAISRRPMADGGSVSVHQDITAQKRAEEKISRLAHYDALTSLANRAFFMEHVKRAAERYQRRGVGFALHLLDLDRFKEVNDTLGHALGDSLLVEVAGRLRACVRPGDVVARLGGDEFTVLQTAVGEEEAIPMAERLLQVIAQPFDLDGHRLTIETSAGIVLAPDHGLETNELLKKADLALYGAKADGRNSWRLFEPEMEREARARLTLAMDLRNAVAREQFELYYQSVVSVATGAVVGAEALIRWRDARRGLVDPASFVALAEETGLIIPLGEWILRRACTDAAGWPAQLSVAVNLSPVQIRHGNLVEFVKGVLAETGLAPERLELEVTESVLLQRNEENLSVLYELQQLGISIALDDFGIGYSSLSYLLSFPFDKIKIDRKFVAELARRNDCGAIVSAVSSLARTLNITTTAEGVETAEQLALLKAAGCVLAQGHLFDRPRSNLEFDAGQAPRPRRNAVA